MRLVPSADFANGCPFAGHARRGCLTASRREWRIWGCGGAVASVLTMGRVPGRARASVPAPAQPVDRKTAAGGDEQQHQAADDREVLGKMALLHASRRRIGQLPIAVA